MKTAHELRDLFLRYFSEREHRLVRSAPLIPATDPTLLFTIAGMVPFKDVFLGKDKRAYTRATSCQKCLRVSGKHNDLEQVGYTLRHSTFFEMLGNFSFGDYFKEKAIEFGWEFMVEFAGVPVDRMWVSVYEEDDEARRLWEKIGMNPDRIVGLGKDDNFWAMGDVGPCGPCSEMFFDFGEEAGCGKPDCAPGCDCDRFTEIWNHVFMQYNRDANGTLNPLPAPSVDTGMGLERLACVCQGKSSIFECDLFTSIQRGLSELSGVPITGKGQEGIAFRAISDHIRSHCFLLADGIMPSNEGRGYVLRRLIRRANRFGQNLNLHDPFLYKLAGEVISQMGDAYPELKTQQEMITRVIKSEEERFHNTLNRALPLVMEHVEEVKQAGGTALDGEKVFSFYDTFGFPIDLVRDIAKENGLVLDEAGFSAAMTKQKERARAAMKAAGDEHIPDELKGICTRFRRDIECGELTLPIALLYGQDNGRRSTIESASKGTEVEIVLDESPFYAESGGQVSDTGYMRTEKAAVRVKSVEKFAHGAFLHRGIVETGTISVGDYVTCEVDWIRRAAIERSHSATHLLHNALRSILGEHVKQSGSLVEPDRLRFDFTHFGPPSEREISMIESLVNERIREDSEVITSEMAFEEAVDQGALAFFGEKYGDRVRMVNAGGFSKELCGGTHIDRTGEIGLFRILSTGSISAGVRRMEALTGEKALEYDNHKLGLLKDLGELLKSPQESVIERVTLLLEEAKALRHECDRLKDLSINKRVLDLINGAEDLGETRLIAANLGDERVDFLRKVSDRLKEDGFSGVSVLAASDGKKVILICSVSEDLTNRLDAGHIIREVSAKVGGSGGGRKDFAQAGGSRPEQLDEALSHAKDVVQNLLAKK
ncbi:MAG: alanine--tRNA ligase [Candidatus Coatesbacteria bacterium]|nr:alanine--tRNA ligase [Candidatus Coatesbacteria bacterium]